MTAVKPIEFYRILKNETYDLEKYFESLSATVEKYPYFQTANALLLKATDKKNENFESVLQKVALLTQDRTALFKYFSAPKTAPKTKITVTPPQKSNIKNIVKKDENYAFGQWLGNSVLQKKAMEIGDQQAAIINHFIAENPKMPKSSAKEQENHTPINPYVLDEKIFMTETLAMVYLKQQRYQQAKNAYKILGLKYPEKKALFADKIRDIEQ